MKRLVALAPDNAAFNRAHHSRQTSLIGDLSPAPGRSFARPAATGAIPYGFMRAQPIAPEVFPVGDQLAAVPSFTGDGMAIALYSGRAAARALLQSAATYQRELIRLPPCRWHRPAQAVATARVCCPPMESLRGNTSRAIGWPV
jgi:menaquinone-9 beta-reductase